MTATVHHPAVGGRRRRPAVLGAATLALLALACLVAGGGALVAHATKRDGRGFYASGAGTLATPTRALVSDRLDADADAGPAWLFRSGRLATLRLTATAAGKPVFLGVGPTADVRAYLRGVAHDAVSDVEVDPLRVTSTPRPGTGVPAAPAAQTFWAASASGAGERTLTWNVRSGAWTVVVMNADGSAGVRTVASVGARVPAVLWAGVVLIGAGVALAAAAASVLVAGRRRPARQPAADGTQRAASSASVGDGSGSGSPDGPRSPSSASAR